MATQLRQAPLRDRTEDRALFVAPDGYERALWAARERLNVLLVAERGAGKTTVLRQLQLALRDGAHGGAVVFVDLAGAETPDRALALIAAAAAEALADAPVGWIPPLPRPGESDADRNTRFALDQLAELEPCTLLLDNVRAEHVGYPLFGTFRDRLWEMPHQWLVGAGELDRRWLLRPPADAFWEEVVEISLTAAAARELLERRLGARPDWLERVVEQVGTNPRSLIAAALAASRDGEGADAALAPWEDWQRRVGELDARSAALIAELSARGAVSASDPDLLSGLGWARTSLLRTLERREAAGLVESFNEPGGRGRPRRLYATTEPGRRRRG